MKKLLIFVLLVNSLLFSQSNNAYQIEVRNVVQKNTKTYEFDIYIKSPNNINITAYQCVFTFNQQILNTGTLRFEYIDNSSQMTNKPIKTQIINDKLALASGPGMEQISEEKRIGKFRLTSTTDFPKKEKINLLWNFSGDINTIFTGTDSKDITNSFIFKSKK